MNIWHKPTGWTIRGHVLDVNVAAFNRALKQYDKQLYTVWNPHKMRGWGCWEIRRLPNQKMVTYQCTHEGNTFFKLEYVETDIIHHVMDCAFLNYDAIRRLKEIDAWNNPNWVADLERREETFRQRELERRQADLKYSIKQNKTVARDFMEAVRSGVTPAQILLSTSWAQKDS